MQRHEMIDAMRGLGLKSPIEKELSDISRL